MNVDVSVPTTAFLVRHAVPVAASDMDPTLSELGMWQAEILGTWLAEEQPEAVYASHLQRAVETAAPLAKRLGLVVQVREDLKEWTTSRTHYTRPEDLAATAEGLAYAEARFEDFVPVHDRAALQRTMVNALREIGLEHAGRKVVVVSHGGALNSLLAHAAGSPSAFFFNPAYTGVSRLQVWPDGRLVIGSINETAHLDPGRLESFLSQR
jgi:probable phosphoglycerate mutase